MKCECDACGSSDFHELEEGYCGFCSKHCFPVGSISGKRIRIAVSETSRRQLHQAALEAEDRAAEAEDFVEMARQELAGAAIKAMGPLLDRGSKQLIDMLRKRIAKS